MTSESNFALEWEIENPETALSSGREESPMMKGGGFEWVVKIERSTDRDPWAIMSLICNENHGGPWECNLEVSYTARKAGGTWRAPCRSKTKLNSSNNTWKMESGVKWSQLSDPCFYNVNGKLTLEIRVRILSSNRIDLKRFMSPIKTSNVTLLIGDKKLVVSKEYLAMHSPVFNATFFGNFEESGKTEVELKEMEYDEFVRLLLVFFPNPVAINDATVLSIAKLADRYQIQGALNAVENHLLATKKNSTLKKLQIADNYRFDKLSGECLQNIKHINELKEFKNSTVFSDKMKIMLYDRMIELICL